MSWFDGAFTGCVLGLILAIPAVMAEAVRNPKHLPLVPDVHQLFGHKIPRNHFFLVSLAIHLLIATFFGAWFPVLEHLGIFSGPTPTALAAYGLAYYLFACLVFFPVIGLGLFGRKEHELLWLELAIVHVLYLIGYWYAATHLFYT